MELDTYSKCMCSSSHQNSSHIKLTDYLKCFSILYGKQNNTIIMIKLTYIDK